jgi:hypothetical protein
MPWWIITVMRHHIVSMTTSNAGVATCLTRREANSLLIDGDLD